MKVIVYFSVDKPLFKRVVMCPDAFDIKSFVLNIKAIFWRKDNYLSYNHLKLCV